jgi:hypothetical protein
VHCSGGARALSLSLIFMTHNSLREKTHQYSPVVFFQEMNVLRYWKSQMREEDPELDKANYIWNHKGRHY